MGARISNTFVFRVVDGVLFLNGVQFSNGVQLITGQERPKSKSLRSCANLRKADATFASHCYTSVTLTPYSEDNNAVFCGT